LSVLDHLELPEVLRRHRQQIQARPAILVLEHIVILEEELLLMEAFPDTKEHRHLLQFLTGNLTQHKPTLRHQW
jgi:hypothetical protein